MKLSEMVKPADGGMVDTSPDLPLNDGAMFAAQRQDAFAETADDADEDDWGAQLAVAIDIMRASLTYLRYFEEVNKESGFVGEKGMISLASHVEELSDFLGDYTDN